MRRAQTAVVNNIDTGIVTRLPPNAIPKNAWSNGLNIRFKNGRVETSPGWEKYSSQQLTGPVRNLNQYFKLDNTDYAMAITNTKIYYYSTGTGLWTDITGGVLTGAVAEPIQSDTILDFFIFVNNIDRVKKWDGTGTISNVGGLTVAIDEGGGTIDVQAAKGVVGFSGFVHLINTIEDGARYSQRWRWSRFNDAESWDNVGTYGQAGFTDITDGPDKLQAIRRLGGDFVALYKERSIHIAQYVGPPTVWSRRLIVSDIGLLAPGAVTSIINEHVFIANDNIYIFNGVSIKPIGTPIFDRFISELNPAKTHLIWAHTIYEENEIIFAYPSGSSDVPDKALVLNYQTEAWSFRDMPFMSMGNYRMTDSGDSWDSDSDTWDSDVTRWDDTTAADNAPIHLGGDEDGYVHVYGTGYSQDGGAHDSYVISPALDLKRPDAIKRFFRILADLVATGAHNMEISYLTVNNPNQVLSWSAVKNLPCDLSTVPWITVDIAGRYGFVRFRTNGTNNPWRLTGYGCEYIIRGYF